MVDGRIFLSTATGGALVDAATGKQLADGLDGAPDVVRGVYGVSGTSGADGGYAVYRVTS